MLESTVSVPMNILCVDDEMNILSSLRRLLRPHGFQIFTAESGVAGIGILESNAIDLVISDMRMPEMDGAHFLEIVRGRWPDTTRLLLTGYADVDDIMSSVNRGEIYRYITKPWNDHDLILIVKQALERKALELQKRQLEKQIAAQNEELKVLNAGLEVRVQERTAELQVAHAKLKSNYLNSIKVFSSLMELRGRSLSGHSRQVADLARRTAVTMGLNEKQQQEIFVAGLLHDIGLIGLADSILTRPVGRLTEEEMLQYRRHPAWGEQALLSQEDMQGVASLIRWHHERHDGKGFPDGLAGDRIPLSAAILIVVEAYMDMQSGNLSTSKLTAAEARSMILHGRGNQFNPEVVDVFLQVLIKATPNNEVASVVLGVDELRPGMVVAKDLTTRDGIVLLSAEHVLTEKLISLLRQRESKDEEELRVAIKLTSRR
ncbi:HD domain-containing phosphohydrolase [Rhodoferax sp. GW822-FHT02A01]|uniref:HD domain-containing phosphohydrolase n=1 Tax=Rhodoferax sp. GW822-FHT02A01 TaxID=3141537 RepID=UPI00315D6B1D